MIETIVHHDVPDCAICISNNVDNARTTRAGKSSGKIAVLSFEHIVAKQSTKHWTKFCFINTLSV